jgi:flavodoxin
LAAQQSSGRALVAFFSRTGNTRTVARHVQRLLAADLFEIEPAQAYPEDYEATVAQAKRETETSYEPPLKERISNISRYDVVFLGFPVCGTTAPPVIRSFLARHELSSKTLVPIITHGGYGLGQSMQVLTRHAPRARVVEGFIMQAPQERQTVAQVARWVNEAGGSYVK